MFGEVQQNTKMCSQHSQQENNSSAATKILQRPVFMSDRTASFVPRGMVWRTSIALSAQTMWPLTRLRLVVDQHVQRVLTPNKYTSVCNNPFHLQVHEIQTKNETSCIGNAKAAAPYSHSQYYHMVTKLLSHLCLYPPIHLCEYTAAVISKMLITRILSHLCLVINFKKIFTGSLSLLLCKTSDVTEPAEIRFRQCQIQISHFTSVRIQMRIYCANYLQTVLPNKSLESECKTV